MISNNVKDSKIKMNFVSWLTAIFFVFYISGFESAYVNYMISAGTMGLTLMYMVMYGRTFSEGVWKSTEFKLVIVFLLLFFYYMFVFGKDTVKHTMANYIMFIPLVVYLFYQSQPNIMRSLFIFIMIAWIFFAIRAYYMYSNEIVAARGMASHQVDKNVFTGGGYGFAVGSAMLAVFLIEMLIWGNIKKYKFGILALIILLMLVIKETYSTITILATAIGVLTAAVFKFFGVNTVKHISVKHVLLIVFVIISIMLFFLYKEELGRYIIRANARMENVTQKRMIEIGHFLMDSGNLEKNLADMTIRLNMVKSSWAVFFENPIFGLVYKHGAEGLERFIGSHGEFADTLAKFGIVAGVPFIAIFVNTLIKERRMQKNKIGFGYLTTIVILVYFNPFIYFQSMTVFFFIIPAITLLYNSEINEKPVLNEPLSR